MALVYNQPGFAQRLLEKYKKSPPSFSIDYYDDHWLLNKAPTKFLYTQPFSSLLDDVNSLRIPVDFIELFDAANVSYFEGCMIVENIDHRKPRTHHQQSSNREPESVRVVLHPNPETLYADLCLLNAKYGNTWTDMEALDIEAKILNAVVPPLHLDPDPNYTRIVNSVIQATTLPETVPRKRKLGHELEENESEKAKRTKLWTQYMHPRHGKSSISQKRSLFDTLGEIATKDQKGVYTLKYRPVRPPKKDPAAVPQSTASAATPSQVAPQPAPVPVATTSVVPTLPPQDEPKLRPVIKHATEVPAMTNGKPKPIIAQPMAAASPIVPSPAVDQQRASVPPVNRTPVVNKAVLANSPTPVPQPPQHIPPPQMPAASPRLLHPPADVSQLANRPALATAVKPEDHRPPPGAQTHVQPSAAVPPNASAQWQQYLAAQNHTQLQHPLPQAQPPHPQPQAKPHQPQPQLSSPHPTQISPRGQVLPQLPPTQPLTQPESQPQARMQSQQSPSPSQAQPQSKPQLPPQAQKKQPTPQPPQAIGHPLQVPLQGFANRAPYPQNMYKAPGVVAQHPGLTAQRSSPLAHPSQQTMPHAPSPHPAAQQTQQGAATGTPMQPHTMPHPNQWSLVQQQQATAARYLQSQQAAATAHHPQVLPQHGHPIGQQHHPQQQNMPRTAQDPSQQAMMHAQMQYNPMYSYQMHTNMLNGLRMPQNAVGQAPNTQYIAWRAAQAAGRGGGAAMGTMPVNAQYQQQLLAAMRAQQQQQQQQQHQQQQQQQQQAQVPQGIQR